MSDTSLPRPALGVGALIGDTVRVFFSRIVTFVVLSLLPTAITVGVQVLILGVGAVVSPGQPWLGAVSGVGLVVVSLTRSTLVSTVCQQMSSTQLGLETTIDWSQVRF